MPTYTVLGATGSTGSELVKLLMNKPDAELHVYARSESKLNSMFPSISSNPNVKAFFGPVTDTALLSRCISDSAAVFSTVATNSNEPGCSVAQTVAASIVSALEHLRWLAKGGADGGGSWQPPRVIWLTSMSVNPAATKFISPVVKPILYRALWYTYEDLRMAEEYIKTEAPWIPLTCVCPGGLVEDAPQGVEVGQNSYSDTLGYADLAAGMLMMAEDDSSRNQSWGLASKGPTRSGLMFRTNAHRVILGLVSSYVPGAFGVIRWLGWL